MKIEELHSHYLKTTGASTDTRTISKGCMFFALKGENFNGNDYAKHALEKGAKYAVVDDKMLEANDRFFLVDNVLSTLQKLATYHRKAIKTPIIALTGSNGKTTTKELINAVLSKNYRTLATRGNLNNHIGVPLTLLELNKETEIGIIEMGANHQKEIEFLCSMAYPDYGLITNFGKAHLEGFGGVEGIIKGKSEMYDHLRAHKKHIFVNANDALQVKQAGFYDSIIKFGGTVKLLETEPFLILDYDSNQIRTQLTGDYNFNNFCAAIAIGEYFNVSQKDIVSALEGYSAKNNRSQLINKGNLEIILDAYNANPTSMEAALKSFSNKSVAQDQMVILGDMFELGEQTQQEHQKIIDLVLKLNFAKSIFVGRHFYEQNITYSNQQNSENIYFFESYLKLKSNIQNLQLPSGKLLIKGSRGMALERVLDIL